MKDEHKDYINHPIETPPQNIESPEMPKATAPNTNNIEHNLNDPNISRVSDSTRQNETKAAVIEEKKTPESHGAGIIVLQWLTYAFWGLTLISLSTLTIAVLTFYLLKNADVGNFPLYSMAAVLVLLPLSVICDIFYSKHEPAKKKGAAAVIMIIHAVIFALLGIGSVIAVVFSLVSLFVGSTESDGNNVALYSSVVMSVLFITLFLRTILLGKLVKFRKLFVIFMIIAVAIVCGFSIFGPVADARQTRNDRLIEGNLQTVSLAINKYATAHKTLPNNLNDISLSGNAKKLVTDNLVAYTKDTKPAASTGYSSYKTHYYQLCVTYKKAHDYQYGGTSLMESEAQYGSYISPYHPVGKKCYNLKASQYDYNDVMPASNEAVDSDNTTQTTTQQSTDSYKANP